MGRPKVDINWRIVEDLLISGCPGTEVAGHFGLHPNTIYEKCLEDHGIGFTEYSLGFYQKGKALLRNHQYKKALGKTEEGDNALLIWLGKVRLFQKEEVTMSETDHKKVAEIVLQIDKAQKLADPSLPDESTNP